MRWLVWNACNNAFESGLKVNKIRSFDIDNQAVDIAEIFNKSYL